jgi:hypothetical protein
MTRRLIAAATFATMVGGLAVAAVPAYANNNDDNHICVGHTDSRNPGHGLDPICIDGLIGPDN